MNTVTISTDGVAEEERLAYWQEMVGRTLVDMRTEPKIRESFFGRFEHREVGCLPVTYLSSTPQRVYRGHAEIARSSREDYFICVQLAGTVQVCQGREARVSGPGDFELLDGTRPGELHFDKEYRCLVISVPHHVLRPRLPEADRMIGMVVRSSGGVGALVSSYLSAFVWTPLAEPVAEAASDILVDLLALVFNATSREARAETPGVREARRHAIRAYVERNLADPSLSPASVASHFHMSPRYLHGLFAEGGEKFMRWVFSRRLERCRKDLGNPAMRTRTIAEIAWGWGFQDLSHFGRAFKAAYGMTPREWRRGAPEAEASPH
jgi:AraC family transcriptional regulator, positive regulator of tynA and feaB